MKIFNPEFIFDLLKGQKPRVLLQELDKLNHNQWDQWCTATADFKLRWTQVTTCFGSQLKERFRRK